MAISPVTVTFNLLDFLGFVPDPRRTKVLLTTNVESGWIGDSTSGGGFRISDAAVTISDAGVASFSVLPSGATGLNPANYQIRVQVDAANPVTRDRKRVDLGWYTIAAAGDLKDLAAAQYVPPTYVTQATQTIDAKVATVSTSLDGKVTAAQGYADDAAASAQQAHDISNIDVPDDVVTALVNDSGSTTSAALKTSYVGAEASRQVPKVRGTVASTTMFEIPTVRRHNAFPSLARLADGRWFVAWRGGYDHQFTADGDIYWATSDDGRTWTAPTLLDRSAVPSHGDARDPSVTVLADGTLLLAFYDAGPARTYLVRSTDAGATWTAPVELPFTPVTYAFQAAPIVVLPSGAWLAAAYDGSSPNRAQVIRSTDQGATWSAPVILTPPGSVGYLEPNLLSIGGANVVMFARGSDGRNMYRFTSTDDGLTWSAVANAFTGTGNPHVVRFSSGTIACMYRHPDHGAFVLRSSFDDGVTWTRPFRVGESLTFMGYASAVETSERTGQALCVWSSEDNGPCSLMATTLSEAGGVSNLGPIPHPAAEWSRQTIPDRMWLPAQRFASVAGSPATGVASTHGGWLLDPAGSEAVSTLTDLPDKWTAFDAVVWCATTDASLGAVVFDMSYNNLAETANLSAGTFVNGNAVSISEGVTGDVRTLRVLTDIAVPEGGLWYFRVIRDGVNVSDTYAADILFLGLELRRKE